MRQLLDATGSRMVMRSLLVEESTAYGIHDLPSIPVQVSIGRIDKHSESTYNRNREANIWPNSIVPLYFV